jgi:hypothetical protein
MIARRLSRHSERSRFDGLSRNVRRTDDTQRAPLTTPAAQGHVRQQPLVQACLSATAIGRLQHVTDQPLHAPT